MADNNPDHSHSELTSDDEGDYMDEDIMEGSREDAPSEEVLRGWTVQIEANMYDYDAHINLINGLRKAAKLDELRHARKQMASVFPLTEELWLQWIEDEKSVALTPPEKEGILSLFAQATNDYLSIRIWDAYLKYASEEYLSGLDDEEHERWITLVRVREIAAQAIHATSWHFAESHVVWNTYKDLELKTVKLQQTTESVEKVRSMFLDRLRIPHSALEDTFQAYSQFESTFDASNYDQRLPAVNSVVAKTRQGVAAREQHEQQLKDSGFALHTFLSYVGFEKKNKKEAQNWVRALYERAVTIHCLDPSVWDAYIIDMMSLLQVSVILLGLTERAVKNCYMASDLWSHRIRIMTFFEQSAEQIADQYQRGLAFVLMSGNIDEVAKLLQTRCECAVRELGGSDLTATESIRALYKESIVYLNTNFPPGDPYLRLERAWIRLESGTFKNPESAHQMYQEVARKSSECDFFLEWANFERTHGGTLKVRSVYRQAAIKKLDWPERLFHAWLTFEKENGSISEFYEAVSAVRTQQEVIERRRQKVAEVVEVADNGKNKRRSSLSGEQKQHKRPRGDNEAAESTGDEMQGIEKEKKPNQNEKKGNLYEFRTVHDSNAGNMVYVTNLSPRVNEKHIRAVFSECGKISDVLLKPNEESGELEALVEFQNVHEVRKAVSKTGVDIEGQEVVVVRCRPEVDQWKFSTDQEESKIYVNNLSGNVQKSLLREAFSQFGKLLEVRLVLRKTAAFAYIEFENAEAAKKSLKLNRTEIEAGTGRKIGVAISDPRLTKPKQIDQREVYVSNLAQSLQKEDLEVAFSEFGTVKDVRMIVKENIDSNRAFVEFENEASAKAALSLNGTMLDGRVVMVTVPDPNLRGLSRRGRGGSERGRGSGRGRTGLGFDRKAVKAENGSDDHKMDATSLKPPSGFVPRVTRPAGTGSKTGHRKQLVQTRSGTQAGSSSNQTAAGPSNAGGSAPAKGKTQDDFRRLMFGK
ncbi:Splicing factor [Rhizophlyctis rosea]|uniref:Splicing factor n=1 Tax=Rhizophlyctis rosea TaxID=64517 RepID=A0AAD5SM29_9FUNG|nr:Splicing factor [Rhizophlyctis rosea]